MNVFFAKQKTYFFIKNYFVIFTDIIHYTFYILHLKIVEQFLEAVTETDIVEEVFLV